MKFESFLLNVTSENPERLIEFYQNTLGLEPEPNIGEGAFKLNEGTVLHIDGHSETKGPNRDPQRYFLDFFVADVAAEEAALKAKGVTFSRSQGVEFWGGVISTFADPDGNYVQIIQFDPSRATNPEEAAATA